MSFQKKIRILFDEINFLVFLDSLIMRTSIYDLDTKKKLCIEEETIETYKVCKYFGYDEIFITNKENNVINSVGGKLVLKEGEYFLVGVSRKYNE